MALGSLEASRFVLAENWLTSRPRQGNVKLQANPRPFSSSEPWRGKLMKLLAQFQPGTFQSAWVVSPIGPARGNPQNDWIQEGEVPEGLENLGVFGVLDSLPNGLQTN